MPCAYVNAAYEQPRRLDTVAYHCTALKIGGTRACPHQSGAARPSTDEQLPARIFFQFLDAAR